MCCSKLERRFLFNPQFKELHPMLQVIQNRLNLSILKFQSSLRDLLHDQRGELDEKAILIAFFVIVVAAAVTLLGTRVSDLFEQLAGMV
jgi:Flp pilus assembly pilin Flp